MGSGAFAADDGLLTEAEVKEIEEKQAHLIEAYNDILSGMQSGIQTYSADVVYGGAYIDEEYLHINVVGSLTSARIYYSALCDNPSILRFHSVSYAYDDLVALAEVIVEANIENLVCIGVNDASNSIYIGVNEKLIELNLLQSEISKDTFLSNVKKSIETAVSRIWTTELSYKFDPNNLPLEMEFDIAPTSSATELSGGRAINKGGGNFTLGICGRYVNSSGTQITVFITCGHSLAVGDAIYDGVSGALFGYVIRKQFTNNGLNDYSIVQITNTSALTPTNRVGGATMTSLATSHPVGTAVTKNGVNGYATGTIKLSSCYVYYSDQSVGVYDLVKVEINPLYANYCREGDSGCSIYTGSTFRGIYSGDDKVLNANGELVTPSTVFYYSKINAISGFTLWT